MKTCVVAMLWLVGGAFLSQGAAAGANLQHRAAYPEAESAQAWKELAASFVRKAIREQTLVRDRALNMRVDAVMNAIGAAVGAIDARFAHARWKAILINDFGYGAVAFPGETILVDANFVRKLQLNDDELALILAHEAAHVLAGHAAVKLSFMAEFVGKEKIPSARSALLEFLARNDYATAYRPTATRQEREADRIGAAIFFATGYELQSALRLFDKLSALETRDNGREPESHDPASVRKQAVSGVIDDLRAAQGRRNPGIAD